MKQKIILIWLLGLLGLLASCNIGGHDGTPLIKIPTATSTSTVTPSPTVCPEIVLPPLPKVTPIKQNTLYIVLFDPNEAATINLYNNKTLPVYDAILHILRTVMKGGDRFVIFKMGCRYRDYTCRMVNYLLPTPPSMGTLVPPSPTPKPSLTPIPSPTISEDSTLFRQRQIARAATETATAIVPTATAIAIQNECAVSEWNKSYLEADTQRRATQSAFQTEVANLAATEVANGATSEKDMPTPYAPNVVFDGLAHASQVLRNERNHFDQFVILIFDTTEDWRLNIETGQIHDLSFANEIDLDQAQVFMIMPDCIETYDPPRCKKRADAWRPILMGKFGALSAEPIPNSRVLERFLTYLSVRQK